MISALKALMCRAVPAALFMTSVSFGAVTLSPSPTTLQFSATAGSTTPITSALTVTVTGLTASTPCCATVAPSVGRDPWISISPSSRPVTADGAPLIFTVSAYPTGLSAGNYSASIGLNTTGPYPVSFDSFVVQVHFAVNAVVDPLSLSFTAVVGGTTPAPRTLHVTSPGASATFAASADQKWLAVSSNATTTPGDVVVSVSPSSLAAGIYTGAVTITAGGISGSAVKIPVTLILTSPPTLSAAPLSLALNYSSDGVCSTQQINISSSSPSSGVAWSASGAANSGPNWISLGPSSGATPGVLSVSCKGTGLTPGTYGATVTISASGASNVAVNVALTVAGPAITVLSAASGDRRLAPGMIASIYGQSIAKSTASGAPPLPTTLAGASVSMTDNSGTTRPASLFFVSANQINILIPDGIAIGLATLMINSATGLVALSQVQISAVAPGLFLRERTPLLRLPRSPHDTSAMDRRSRSMFFTASRRLVLQRPLI